MKVAYHPTGRKQVSGAGTVGGAGRNASETSPSLGAHGQRGRAAATDRPGARKAHRMGKGRRLRNLAVFTRQLHILVVSGSTVVDALTALERQTKDGAWREVLASIRRQIEEGRSLSEAMETEPECFDSIYCSLVAAGESSGQLASVLDRLANLARKRLHVRNSILGAMMYPALLLCVALVVMGLLLIFVIPRFAQLFQSLDAPLPATTRVMIAISDFLRSYWWAVLALAGGAVFALRLWLRSPGGKRWVDTWVLRIPRVGGIVQDFTTAWIARMMGILLEGHVPVLEALRLTRQSVSNVHYAELVCEAEKAVTRGERISAAFAKTPLISPSLYEAMRSGEQSGRLGPLLMNVADFMDEDNEVIIRSLTSILEPIILVLLGGLVALVAMSLFTPLFDLTSITQEGGR
jgi:type II secretory pathway component PulF